MTVDGTEVAQLTTAGGVATACGGSALWTVNNDMIILVISLLGVLVAVMGLIYTIWSGQRSYQLQLREFQIKLKNMGVSDESE